MGVGWEAERKTGGMEGEETQPHSHTAKQPHTNRKLLLHYLEHLGEQRIAHHKEEGCVLKESVDREAAVREHVVRGTDGGGEVERSRAVW